MKIKVRLAEKKTVEKKINTEFIRLDAFLKLTDAVQSGGHAKIVIQGGEVKVNGEVCLQRGKKLRPGDTAEYNGTVYLITPVSDCGG
ncbi:MAG: RNA-binding S4 domain-containing protein [Clostridia bacterium]|nr:RNA-binding S4 domain-containing protein [Clostridia bacterium]